MKWIYSLWRVLLIGVFLGACGNQKSKTELPVINMNRSVADTKLKISDILDQVRIVKLETCPEALLPGFFYVWVGDKYIITLGQEEIHLFTADGKHIRKIAEQGRGPEEYLYTFGYCVDRQEEYLYLADGTKYICVIDLNEGKMVRKIETDGAVPYQLILTGTDTLTYIPFPLMDEQMAYDLGQIKTDGTMIGRIQGVRKGDAAGMLFLGECNGNVHYKINLCDTLFYVKDMKKIPYCRIVTDQPYSMVTREGKTVDVLFENKDLFILADMAMKEKTEGDMMYSESRFLGHYLFEKSDFQLKKITGFYVDILDYTATERFPFLVAGKRAYHNLNVARFKEILKDKLDSPLIADYLKELYRELKEDDNPLLLIGDIKE